MTESPVSPYSFSNGKPFKNSSIAGSNDTSRQEDKQEEESKERLYRLGDSGDEIVEAQTKLKELGYYDAEVTGYFGEVTEQSVLAFQIANNITNTGAIGEETWAALFSDNAVKNEKTEEETQPETEAETEQAATEAETEPDADASPEAETQEQPAAQPATTAVRVNPVVEKAEDNIAAVKQVVEKTNKLNKKALSKLNDNSDSKTVSVTSDEKNTNFVLWLLLVLGAAAIITGVMFTYNRRSSAYSGSRSKGSKKKDEVPVRYW